MRDLSARLALIAVALTMVGKIFMSTMAPSKSGPKNGTYTNTKTSSEAGIKAGKLLDQFQNILGLIVDKNVKKKYGQGLKIPELPFHN